MERFVIIVEASSRLLLSQGAPYDNADVLDPPVIHWDFS